MMNVKQLLSFILILIPFISFAQPANDDCANATDIPNPVAWCSSFTAYDNTTATASPQATPSCWTNVSNDVWFSFTAIAKDASIQVRGNTTSGSGGTMPAPEIAVYDGCAGTELGCATDNNNFGIIQLIINNLTIGQVYYIRIDSRDATVGTYQLCVDNYNSPPDAGSDCVVGTILCDKAPFSVQSLVGGGNDVTEVTGTCVNSEHSSVWYKWTCDQAGTLTFTLTPNNNAPNGQADDLDFAVYELPNGVNDCSNKNLLRCMASGEILNSPLANWIACTGPTGLNLASTDFTETAGCASGDDNFVAALNMTTGTSYALIVNNYSNTGLGFSINWGGTGTFLGPTADFTISDPDATICVGENLTVTDASTYTGGTITDWTWNFGLNAVPQFITGAGPHSVIYNRPGSKSILLTIETDEGCTVTKIVNVQVNACCETMNKLDIGTTQTDLVCASNPDGAIGINVNSAWAPYNYQWTPSTFTGSNLNGLSPGNYSLTFTDAIGCDTIIDFTINSPPYFEVNHIIQQPTCAGGQDGVLTMNVTGATPPYLYDFGSGFSANNVLANIPNGLYPVTVRDANGCDTMMNIRVWELELELDTLTDYVQEPLCFGDANGSITVSMGNGAAPYQYNWGSGFQGNNSLTNLVAGTYDLTVQDGNMCQGVFQIEVPQPDSLSISLLGENVTCFDGNDGRAIATVTGGVGGYTYQWSDGQFIDTATNLVAGTYSVTVTDLNGCTISESITITQPPIVNIEDVQVQDVYCYGGNDGALSVSVSGGTPPFEYSIDGITFQTDSVFRDLFAGDYTVTVRDIFGCEYSDDARVNQPWEFWIEAGEDVTVDLGFSTNIDALVNTNPPVTYSWTPPDGLSCADCEDPTALPTGTTTYVVEAVDSRGCIAYDSLTVFVNIIRNYFVPNAFTPNYDGLNDYFYVQGGPAIARIPVLKVFDRWGNAVYEATNILPNDESLGWDGTYRGKSMERAVFAYYIEIEFIDGYIEKLKGDVTLIR